MFLKTFGWAMGVSVLGLAAAFFYGLSRGHGLEFLLLCAILAVLEISLSFDNAVVNATVLVRMSRFWQQMFLTIGILIAVFGMRLVFPLLIVGITAHLNPIEAFRLALSDGTTYGERLTEAHPAIAAFGGMFLLMLFLDFIFEERDITWLSWIEKPLAKLGRLDVLSVVVAATSLVVAAEFLAHAEFGRSESDIRSTVLVAGVFGIVAYLLTNGLGELFEASSEEPDEAESAEVGGAAERRGGPSALAKATGKAGFFLFLYLEVLDASFSFDGVIGAFAITSDIVIIALGLGIGAMYIRSTTILLVRRGTLSEYVFLEHGAHYAIGALAVLLLVSLNVDIPEWITGLIGVVFIGASVFSSAMRNRGNGQLAGTEIVTSSREPVTEGV
jgi:hypothetical protein